MSKNDSGNGCLIFFLVLGAIGLVLQAVGTAIKILIIVALSILALVVTYKIIRAIYYFFNPKSKKAYLERIKKEAEETRKREAREAAERGKQWERTKEEQWERAKEEHRKKLEHELHRDGDCQASPYTYQIGKHGNESLAIRYGIANQERKVKEFWYYAKGGERKRNPDRDSVYYEPATMIRLQKTQKLGTDLYEVLLTDYRNRKAKAVIEVGTEYVKTFYPSEESWFKKFADLEETLKGNGTFSLKELATFHVQKTVGK